MRNLFTNKRRSHERLLTEAYITRFGLVTITKLLSFSLSRTNTHARIHTLANNFQKSNAKRTIEISTERYKIVVQLSFSVIDQRFSSFMLFYVILSRHLDQQRRSRDKRKGYLLVYCAQSFIIILWSMWVLPTVKFEIIIQVQWLKKKIAFKKISLTLKSMN